MIKLCNNIKVSVEVHSGGKTLKKAQLLREASGIISRGTNHIFSRGTSQRIIKANEPETTVAEFSNEKIEVDEIGEKLLHFSLLAIENKIPEEVQQFGCILNNGKYDCNIPLKKVQIDVVTCSESKNKKTIDIENITSPDVRWSKIIIKIFDLSLKLYITIHKNGQLSKELAVSLKNIDKESKKERFSVLAPIMKNQEVNSLSFFEGYLESLLNGSDNKSDESNVELKNLSEMNQFILMKCVSMM
jgi:hypothetical protein